jgi:hypothetical protein
VLLRLDSVSAELVDAGVPVDSSSCTEWGERLDRDAPFALVLAMVVEVPDQPIAEGFVDEVTLVRSLLTACVAGGDSGSQTDIAALAAVRTSLERRLATVREVAARG